MIWLADTKQIIKEKSTDLVREECLGKDLWGRPLLSLKDKCLQAASKSHQSSWFRYSIGLSLPAGQYWTGVTFQIRSDRGSFSIDLTQKRSDHFGNMNIPTVIVSIYKQLNLIQASTYNEIMAWSRLRYDHEKDFQPENGVETTPSWKCTDIWWLTRWLLTPW